MWANPNSTPPLKVGGAIGLHSNLILTVMKFQQSNLVPVDFNQLQQGDVANATFASFNFRSGFVFATLVADGQSVSCIIGKQSDYKIADLLPLKGLEVEITYGGTKVTNGVSYPRYYVAF